MNAKRLSVALTVLSLVVIGACDDDAPSTNTGDRPTSTAGNGTTQASTQGNVGDITGEKPVAGEHDSVVQGNQPMQTFDTGD